MKHSILLTALVTWLFLCKTLSAQCPSPTPAGSCPNFGGCTYIPLHYFTFDNNCAPFKDCMDTTEYLAGYSAQLGQYNSMSAVGSYGRMFDGLSDTWGLFSDNFFPNGDSISSKQFTYEFLLRINSDVFTEIDFYLRDYTLFRLSSDRIFFQEKGLLGGTSGLNQTVSYLSGTSRLSTDYFQDRNWHHIVCKFDGINGVMQLWIDGQCPPQLNISVPVGSLPYDPVNNPIHLRPQFLINGLQDSSSVDVDEIAFYDEALPTNFIYQHYLDTQNGDHYSCNPDTTIVAPTPVDPLAGVYDTLDFVPYHPLDLAGVPLTLDDLGGSVPQVVDQLKSFPLPRLKKGHGLNPNINWMNNEYLGRVSKVVNSTNDINIQEELCKRWNYMFSLTQNADFPGAYPDALNSFANAHTQYKYSIATNMNQISVSPTSPDLLNASSSCTGLPSYWAPNQNTVNYFDSLGKKTLNNIIAHVINGPATTLTNNIDYISENGFEGTLFSLTSSGCPYNDAVAQATLNIFSNTFGGSGWQSYYGQCRKIFDSAYRDQIVGQHSLIPSGTKYSRYLISSVFEEDYFENYEQLRPVNTPFVYNGNNNYYSTPDFYVPKTYQWKDPFNGNMAWNNIVENPYGATYGGRKREIQLGDSLFAPFVAAGWTLEHANVRPGQWLGLLKGLGVLGADFYHTGYFNETDSYGNFPTGPDPVDPRGWCYQAVMPVYAQGITTRFEKILHASDIFYHKIKNMSFVLARHVSSTDKYLLYGSLQQFSNIIGNTPYSTAYRILDSTGAGAAINGLKFEIRRQGSTYIYDSGTKLFYQLDKWHERTHPSYWSKDFEFEAEVNDYTDWVGNKNDLLNTTMSLVTEVPLGTPGGDFTDFTTYVEYASPSAPTKSYYYFEPRSVGSSGTKTYTIYIRARASATVGASKIDCDIKNMSSNVTISKTMPCIEPGDFKWYNFAVALGTIGATPQIFTVSLTQNQEYEIAFTGYADVHFDKFIISEANGKPLDVDSTDIISPCPTSNRPAGLSHFYDQSSVSIYPNPTTGRVSIELTDDFLRGVKVFNMQGLLIHDSSFGSKNQTVSSIDLNDNKNGVYILEIKTAKGISRKKLVLSK